MNIPQNEVDELVKKVLEQNSLIDAMNLIVFKAYKYGRKENESVLEDIKAEVSRKLREVDFMDEYSSGYNSAIDDVIDIIDNYINRKEES